MSRLERALYPHFYPIEGDFYPTSTTANVAPIRPAARQGLQLGSD